MTEELKQIWIDPEILRRSRGQLTKEELEEEARICEKMEKEDEYW